MREDLNRTSQELEQKREIVSSVEGAEVLKGEDVSGQCTLCVSVCVCVSVRVHACVPLWSTDAARGTIQYSVNSWCCQFYSNQCLVLPV